MPHISNIWNQSIKDRNVAGLPYKILKVKCLYTKLPHTFFKDIKYVLIIVRLNGLLAYEIQSNLKQHREGDHRRVALYRSREHHMKLSGKRSKTITQNLIKLWNSATGHFRCVHSQSDKYGKEIRSVWRNPTQETLYVYVCICILYPYRLQKKGTSTSKASCISAPRHDAV